MFLNRTFLRKKFNLSKFFQLPFNSWMVRRLPFALSRRYIAVIGKLYFTLNRQEKDLIRRTISHVCQA